MIFLEYVGSRACLSARLIKLSPTASEIDAVLRKMISNAYHQTEQVLKEHMSKLHEVAKQLFLNEKMSGEEFYAIMEGPSPAEVPQEAGTTTENSVSENTEEKTEE